MFAMLVEHFDSIPSNKILMIFILLTSNEVIRFGSKYIEVSLTSNYDADIF